MINIVLKPDMQRPGFYILQDIRNLPDSTRQRVVVRSHAWHPPTDVFETDEMVVVRVEIAGMEETDFTIIAHGLNRGLKHALIEIRQDLIADDRSATDWGELMCDALKRMSIV